MHVIKLLHCAIKSAFRPTTSADPNCGLPLQPSSICNCWAERGGRSAAKDPGLPRISQLPAATMWRVHSRLRDLSSQRALRLAASLVRGSGKRGGIEQGHNSEEHCWAVLREDRAKEDLIKFASEVLLLTKNFERNVQRSEAVREPSKEAGKSLGRNQSPGSRPRWRPG